MNGRITFRKVLHNLGGRHLLAILVSIALSFAAIGYIGNMLYRSTHAELELRGEMDVIQSADRFNAYLIVDKNALMIAGYAVNNLMIKNAPTEAILEYITDQSERMIHVLDESFTGLYGWIRNTYLDGAGWVPDASFVATDRPWYKAALAHPHEVVYVNPYVDEQTGRVMITIAKLLDDGESVIALDIGLDEIQKITNDIAEDTKGAVSMVFDTNHVAIAHSDIGKAGIDYSDDEDSLEGKIVKGIHEAGQNRFDVSFNGRTYMVYNENIEGGWHCVSAIDTDVFYQPLLGVILLTICLGLAAVILVLVIFYRMSRRELHSRNLHIQIQAAADIYDFLTDINLTEDTYYELNNSRRAAEIGLLHTKAQKMMDANVDLLVEENMQPYLREFSDLSTLNARLAGKDTLAIEFLNAENKWCRGRFICAERQADGTVTRVLWAVEIIDDEKRQKEYLRHLAETDRMTGLYNRTTGEYRVTEQLENGKGGMFALFDIDGFKSFNDRFGHTVGDQVIVAVANCLKNAFRGEDVVMRMGGDEFSAFAVGVFDRAVGDKILKRFYDNLENVVIEPAEVGKISVSTGVSFSPEDAPVSFHALYQSSDQCMYESKKTTVNRITYA